MRELHPGRKHEEFRHHMGRGTRPRRAVVQCSRIRLGVRNEFLDGFRGHARMDDQQVRLFGQQRDGLQVRCRAVGQFPVHAVCCVDPDRAGNERIAVGHGARDFGRAYVAACTGLVLHHHRLAVQIAEPPRGNPPEDIGRPAWRERHHQLDGTRREALRR